MYYLHTDGKNSDSVAIIATVSVGDLSNPSAPVWADVNWITSGYTDLQTLTGTDSGGQNTLPSLTLTITGTGDTTIWQGGVPVSAYPLPFVIRSVAPTVAVMIFNGPRVAGTYHATVIFTYPNGSNTIIEEFDFTVT